jgi:hypothetical protein
MINGNHGAAYDRLIAALELHGSTVRSNGSGTIAQCPAHDDGNPSLSVRTTSTRARVHCFAGCDDVDVLTALGLQVADLYDEPKVKYDYGNGYQVTRETDRKVFRQRGKPRGPTPLYRTDRLAAAVAAGRTVYLVEGEEDVHAIEASGGVGTTAPMGAGNFAQADLTPLTGADVVAVVDLDEAGDAWARTVVELVGPITDNLLLMQGRHGKDFSDHYAAGGTLDDLQPYTDPQIAATLQEFPRLDIAAMLTDADTAVREWVVERFVPAGVSVSVVAKAGSMKTLLVQSVAVAVASGAESWAGLRISRARKVLYIDMELTADDLRERLVDLGVTPETNLDRLIYLHLPALPPLDSHEGGAAVEAVCEAHQLARGDVVVLDSTQRILVGPENESDTIRAYYVHTGVRLKRRGLTVIRLDNTGKNEENGARGSSGKVDDVDLELRLTRNGTQLTLKATKTRQRDTLDSLLVTLSNDDDGHITFSTAADPYQAAVVHTVGLLDRLGAPADLSQRKAKEFLAERLGPGGYVPTRQILRDAVHARKSAPSDLGAPFDDEDLE